VLFRFLEERGLMDTTMIVFTSDHGDYLGDHWLGEKDLFHEPSVHVPLIVCDPDPRADATRGSVCRELVEAIDLAPTLIDVYGGAQVPHIIDGRSLRPLLFGENPQDWRRHVISEYDYSFMDAAIELGTKARDAWLRMIFDGRYKYILAEDYPPMLFDLESDPSELVDRGTDPSLEPVRARLHEALFEWARQPRQRATVPDRLMETTPIQQRITQTGVLIGYWDEAELIEAQSSFRPLFAAHNPLVRPTLEKLTSQPHATPQRHSGPLEQGDTE
jgi:arylsulfatase A-like enzyme